MTMHNHHSLRAKGNEALSEDQLRRFVPSIFAEAAHGSRSERYAYIPSIAVMRGLIGEGFLPVAARQSSPRDEGRLGASDDALLAKVEKALTKIVPDDFIVTQAETSKLIATDETLNAAISKKAPAAVIQSLTTISCGLKLKNTDMAAILEFVGGLIDAPVFGKAAEQAQAQNTRKLRVVA